MGGVKRSGEFVSAPRQVLEGALRDYRKGEVDLAQYRSKAEKAQREAQASIDNHEISEGAASAKLALWQVLEARVKSRESARNRLLGELGNAVVRAGQELNASVREGWFARRAILGKRGCVAMQIPEKCLELGELDAVLAFSEPLTAVRVFEVAGYTPNYIEHAIQDPVTTTTTDDGEVKVTADRHAKLSQELDTGHLLGAAEQIIQNFDGLAKEMERKI